MLEQIDEDDFVTGAGEEDASETEGVDKDLAKLMGLKDKEKKEKKEKRRQAGQAEPNWRWHKSW
jgi:hypothetical protein